MEPDVVEIPPPPIFASGSRTRKPRKAGIPEVIDVESYEFRNGGVVNNNNVVDKRNKGKAIQVDSVSYNNVQSHHPDSSPLNLGTLQDYYVHTNSFSQLANQALDVDDYSMFQNVLDSKNVPAGVEVMVPWGLNSSSNGTAKSSRSSLKNQATKANGNPYQETPPWGSYSDLYLHQNKQAIHSMTFPLNPYTVQPLTPDIVMVPAPPNPSRYDASASSSRPIAAEVSSSVHNSPNVRKIKQEFLRDFKRFDTVEDFSDHHYVSKGKSSKQHSKNWVKKVQADWKILENDLPESIYVRACESRMDLMRAVIIGAEGTPYHDGLFFFDIQFPDNYPSVPPKVHYHSGGLRINPNLYNCGKVCLSLLGTWAGKSTRENWLPKESTMLQLLVSIQALILNEKPYYNEPGYERSKGTSSGESHSKAYSENVFVLSLKTMVYSMRKPPQHFEEFVRSHYSVRSHDIVKACNAYKDGAPVGSMVKGGVQDLEQTSKSGSPKFRTDVASYMKTVVDEFIKVGVKELEEKPKPPTESNANTEINKANRKRSRSSSFKEFLANIGRCVFQ